MQYQMKEAPALVPGMFHMCYGIWGCRALDRWLTVCESTPTFNKHQLFFWNNHTLRYQAVTGGWGFLSTLANILARFSLHYWHCSSNNLIRKVFPLYIGLNYYVLTFTLIIWYNALIVYVHVFTLYLYIFKNLYVVISVMNFCNYIYNYTVDSSLTP